MLHEKSCLIINMPKIMIIKYQQFAKTNTFSLFPYTFFPIFPKTHRNQDLGMGKNVIGPPYSRYLYIYIYTACQDSYGKCSTSAGA